MNKEIQLVCVNGCKLPVQWPSKVLCKKCLERLDEKIKQILSNLEKKVNK